MGRCLQLGGHAVGSASRAGSESHVDHGDVGTEDPSRRRHHLGSGVRGTQVDYIILYSLIMCTYLV